MGSDDSMHATPPSDSKLDASRVMIEPILYAESNNIYLRLSMGKKKKGAGRPKSALIQLTVLNQRSSRIQKAASATNKSQRQADKRKQERHDQKAAATALANPASGSR